MARQSPLAATHAAHDARFTDFGGWEMPVEFDSIRTEHAAVRESVGRFDVSHMGQIEVSGPDADVLTGRLVTDNVTDLAPGQAVYVAITDEDGVMLDDTVVYRLPEGYRDGEFLFVPNAGHDAQMYDRWTRYRDEWGLEATVENTTDDLGMVAVQGPDAFDLLRETSDVDPAGLSWFEATVAEVGGVESLLARGGYTGERGVECLCPAGEVEQLWEGLDCQPCGLGARDTLRLEMGFLLSGEDFDPETNPRNPLEAGIDFAVDLGSEFVGRDALERADVEGVDEKLIGVEMIDRAIPRGGYPVTTPDGERLGEVTSGTMSPTLDRGIALAYLPTTWVDGETVRVEVRDEPKKARTAVPPFLDR